MNQKILKALNRFENNMISVTYSGNISFFEIFNMFEAYMTNETIFIGCENDEGFKISFPIKNIKNFKDNNQEMMFYFKNNDTIHLEIV